LVGGGSLNAATNQPGGGDVARIAELVTASLLRRQCGFGASEISRRSFSARVA
jgi:hypothetical protein